MKILITWTNGWTKSKRKLLATRTSARRPTASRTRSMACPTSRPMWTTTTGKKYFKILYSFRFKKSLRSIPKLNIGLIFWEGHKILRNLHRRFVLCSASQIYVGNFVVFSEYMNFTPSTTYKNWNESCTFVAFGQIWQLIVAAREWSRFLYVVFGVFFYFFWPLKSTFISLRNHFLAPVVPNLKVTRLNPGSRLPFLGDRKLHSQHTAPPTKIQISRILLPLMPMH